MPEAPATLKFNEAASDLRMSFLDESGGLWRTGDGQSGAGACGSQPDAAPGRLLWWLPSARGTPPWRRCTGGCGYG